MITPTTHRIIVKQQQLEETSPDHKRAIAIGLIIAETEDKKRAQAGVDKGTVIAFGPTAFEGFNTPNPLSVGDIVAFARYSGKVITDPDDNIDYVALNDEDIVAIITESK